MAFKAYDEYRFLDAKPAYVSMPTAELQNRLSKVFSSDVDTVVLIFNLLMPL